MGYLFVFQVVFSLMIYESKSQSYNVTRDGYTLYLTGNSNLNDYAFCVTNPLQNISSTNYGVYDFWVKYNPSVLQYNQYMELVNLDKLFSIQIIVRYSVNAYYILHSFVPANTSSYYQQYWAYSGWTNVVLVYQQSSKNVSMRYNFNTILNVSLPTGNPHPPQVCYSKIIVKSDKVRMSELKFYSLTSSNYDSNFFERYYGIWFKYGPFVSPFLVDYYASYPAGTDINLWTGTLNSMNKLTYVNTQRTKWDTTSVDNNVYLCPPQYAFTRNRNCTKCSQPCNECSFQDPNKCFSCFSGYYSVNYKCVAVDCPPGYYFNYNVSQCQLCQSPCSTCNNQTSCTYCQSGYLYVDNNNSCIFSNQSCPTGTSLDPKGFPVCRSCPKACATCSSSTNCTSCVAGYKLGNGQCDISCPAGSYINTTSNSCQNCSDPNCLSCNNNGCNLCQPGYFVLTSNNTCVSTCPNGTYANSGSNTCMICQPDCLSCSTNNYTCSSCNNVTFLYNQTCVKKCPYVGYYPNSINRTCDSCNSQCEVCINNVNDCISCKPGALFTNRACLSSCPNQYYKTTTGQCFACDPYCKVCTGSSNFQCQQCNTGYYLLNTTCDTTCPNPYYPNTTTSTCELCKYYCDSCTTSSNCFQCKPGFPKMMANCTGEYFLRTSQSYVVSLPLNSEIYNATFEPKEMTVEIWFKTDDINSSDLQVLIGMTPYKLRKKANTNIIQVSYQNLLNFCETTNFALISNQWYHYAFAISETGTKLQCYLNGQPVDIGTNPAILISQNVSRVSELTVGGTKNVKDSELNFIGYIKELRYWGVFRSNFEIDGFKNIDLTSSTLLQKMIAYWKLNENNDGTIIEFNDYSGSGINKYNPGLDSTARTVQQIMEFREVYLKMCPEGQYVSYNESAGYYQCLTCNSLCKNCIGPTQNDCIECSSPYKLFQEEYTCIIVESCPDGYYMDEVTGLCFRCHQYCELCNRQATNCSQCKPGYFKQYQGTGCVDECPLGMYGWYTKQLCFSNPSVDFITPEDSSIYLHGTFIDATAGYTMNNNEPNGTYSFGWIITKINGNIDITNDVVKTYYNTSILKVHLDNNVLQSNNYYNISFYVKGDPAYYKGMYSILSYKIYLGKQPINGKCVVTPLSGIANITNFTITQLGWYDEIDIVKYKYFYSMDGGDVFLPIEVEDDLDQSIGYSFISIYQKYMDVKIKCQAINEKGFSNQVITSIALEKRSSSDPSNDLTHLSTQNTDNEANCLELALQLKLITQSIGKLQQQNQYYFDPKVDASQCNNDLCNNQGSCIYKPYIKKYYCNCSNGYGGQNCTFPLQSQLDGIRNYTEQVAIAYNQLTDKQYEFEYLKLTTSYKEQLTDVTFGVVSSIINSKIQQWGSTPQSLDDLKIYLLILSNLLEYVDYDILQNNITHSWKNNSIKYQNVIDNLNSAISQFQYVKQNTLTQISDLTPEINLISRMVTYRQVLISQDTLINIIASNATKKNEMTYIKISYLNFQNVSGIYLEQDFVVEAVEYAINPYQIINLQNTATNVFEVNFYNFSDKEQVLIENLTEGFQISFPIKDNENLTLFNDAYQALSPYKAAQKTKRDQILAASQLDCSFWNGTLWDKSGCQLSSIDLTHVICQCNHLTAFAPQFKTPVVQSSTSASSSQNKYNSADKENDGKITLDDLLVPLDKYFKNLQELLQHKQPAPMDILFKPGPYVVLLFWIMYCSSLVYYSGKDRIRRYNMTKSQNRDDLAEIKDDQIQCLEDVMNELFLKDQSEKLKLIDDQNQKQKSEQNENLVDVKVKIFEELTQDEKKILKRRARRKVFGRTGGLCERAKRFYKRSNRGDMLRSISENKMKFFNEELKNNLWFGLLAKTSKIAPRHVRLTLMYLYISLHLQIVTMAFILGYQLKVVDFIGEEMFAFGANSMIPLMLAWIVGIPVALVFRMPMSLRKQVEGVKTKKVNLVFQEIDQQMGCRYAVGYFICFSSYIMMTIIVIFFSYFYPQDYCMSWLMLLIFMYILDLLAFTFAFAGLQLLNSLLSTKVKCFYNVWAAFTILRYIKNLRG